MRYAPLVEIVKSVALLVDSLYRTYPGSCAHVVCRECLDEDEQISEQVPDNNNHCPLCAISGVRPSKGPAKAPSEEQSDTFLQQEGHSSKMAALISDIQEDLWQTKR